MRFLQIFDESCKFSPLIERRHAVDIIMEAKLQKFSQHFHKSYQSTKLVIYGSLFFTLTLCYSIIRPTFTNTLFPVRNLHLFSYCIKIYYGIT